jgi:ABC-2 type transport system permease protein
MSVSVPTTAPVAPAVPFRRTGVGAVYRVEIAKIASQLLPRLTALVCLVGPLAFTLFINTQTQVPADSLFGRWVHSSGFSIPFVTLNFAGIAGFPLIASVVAGDIFAGEDRQSTWKTILTRSSSRSQIFWGKTLAACSFSTLMVLLIAASSIAAGVIVVGSQPVIGLSGASIAAGHALALALESFAIALVPTLAFTCVAVFFSVVSRNSMVGILAPPVLGLLMVLLSLLGSGVVVRSMLLTTPFEAWHGLQIPGTSSTPLWLGAIVCGAFGLASLDGARRSFRRRDFAGDGQAPLRWSGLARGVLITVVIVSILAVGTVLDRTWITSEHVEDSVATTVANLVVVQQRILGQEIDPASIKVYPFCRRESVLSGSSTGAADDWTCQMFIDGPHLGRLAVDYTLTIRPNGCYTADGPPAVIGPLHIKQAGGGTTINPLFAFDGCMIAP